MPLKKSNNKPIIEVTKDGLLILFVCLSVCFSLSNPVHSNHRVWGLRRLCLSENEVTPPPHVQSVFNSLLSF